MDTRVLVKIDSVPDFHLTRSLYERKDFESSGDGAKPVTNKQGKYFCLQNDGSAAISNRTAGHLTV
jgi:hypothetical protein